MRNGITIRLGPGDRERLEAVIASRNSPQKHVWRARFVLLSGDGVGTMEIQRQTGKGKPTIWRWQERFMTAGGDGLLRDKTRPSRKPPLAPDVVARVVEMTLAGRDDALDRPCPGQGGRDQSSQRAADLGGARAAAAPGAHVQAVEGSEVR